MTREEMVNYGEFFLEMNKNSKNSRTYEFIDKALKLLKQEVILDKIRVEIESQREEVSKKHSEDEGLSNYYFGLNDGLKDARDIIDKYKTEREESEV